MMLDINGFVDRYGEIIIIYSILVQKSLGKRPRIKVKSYKELGRRGRGYKWLRIVFVGRLSC
jgi:hypothetical protein